MKTKIVALYERLAQKNNRIIEDQKEQLEEYAEDYGYTNCCHYTDMITAFPEQVLTE